MSVTYSSISPQPLKNAKTVLPEWPEFGPYANPWYRLKVLYPVAGKRLHLAHTLPFSEGEPRALVNPVQKSSYPTNLAGGTGNSDRGQ